MNIRRKIVIGLLTASVIVLSILTASSFYLYQIGIERKTQDLIIKNITLSQTLLANEQAQAFSIMTVTENPVAEPTEKSGQGWFDSQLYENWSVISGDGLKLEGYYFPARISTDRTVIMAHGYGGRGMEMSQFAKFYSEKLGYNVLLPDARGHGASEGDYIGFGWPDRQDVLLWIQKVMDRLGDDAQIALHGLSMGGATVMMVSGESLPEQVKVIIEDSGYTSVYDEFAYLLKRKFNLPGFPFIPATSLLNNIKSGYNLLEASSIKQVRKNITPMLFIHGTSDAFVPTDMVRRLYDACTAEKELYLAEGAGHGMAYYIDILAYEMIVADFIERFIPPQIIDY